MFYIQVFVRDVNAPHVEERRNRTVRFLVQRARWPYSHGPGVYTLPSPTFSSRGDGREWGIPVQSFLRDGLENVVHLRVTENEGNVGYADATLNIAIPEPGSLVMLVSGILVLAGTALARRRPGQ
jgi:hypothetical protein